MNQIKNMEKLMMKNYGSKKSTIFKKAKELSTLCGVDVALIMYGAGERDPEVWSSKPDCSTVINQYLSNKPHQVVNSTLARDVKVESRDHRGFNQRFGGVMAGNPQVWNLNPVNNDSLFRNQQQQVSLVQQMFSRDINEKQSVSLCDLKNFGGNRYGRVTDEEFIGSLGVDELNNFAGFLTGKIGLLNEKIDFMRRVDYEDRSDNGKLATNDGLSLGDLDFSGPLDLNDFGDYDFHWADEFIMANTVKDDQVLPTES